MAAAATWIGLFALLPVCATSETGVVCRGAPSCEQANNDNRFKALSWWHGLNVLPGLPTYALDDSFGESVDSKGRG